jgi:Zn-dependent protease with chaperone function
MAGVILVLAVGACGLLAGWAFRLAHRWAGIADRRFLVLWAMAAPALVLGILLGGAVGMVLEGCPLFTPIDHIVIASTAGTFVALVTLACLRHAARAAKARHDLLAISELASDGPLAEQFAALAQKLGIHAPQLRIVQTSEPIACSFGVRRPAVVIASGLLARLDDREREGVLAHELAHLKQHDPLIGFVIAWLRDALFFMPAANEGWECFAHEREVACDSLSATATGRPGALASALFKVSGRRAQTRLERLLGGSPTTPAGRAAVGYGILAAGAMVAIAALSPIWYTPVCMALFCHIGV